MWFNWATKPVQDSFAWPLTPCDAAGSSYIKKKEPKYLRLWVGLAAVEFVTH